MKYRVSFYLKPEKMDGRAPRYMVDIEANSLEEAKTIVLKNEDAVIRSAYRSVDPIPEKISYVFMTPEDRERWYSSHKTAHKNRLCHVCGTNEVARYRRICNECLEKRSVKPCVLCKKDIQTPNRHRYCDECQIKHKETQEKYYRLRRKNRDTIIRTREQLWWASTLLKTTTLTTCKFAHQYQGIRRPHIEDGGKICCRTCLQKFIDVQTTHLNDLLAKDHLNEAIVSNMENENAYSHATGV